MMIKALILIHLWSVVVAGGAWLLQRDGDEQVGARFPGSNTWLILILLSFLPGVLYFIPFGTAIKLPEIEAFDLIPAQVGDSAADGSSTVNFLAVYIGLGIFLMSGTLWRWSRLQKLPLMPTAEPDIFTTSAEVPPLSLSWPRRAVVIPAGFENKTALIRHERAHLHHFDAELTLLLLLLQDVMLRSPGISYLVRQWRLSIELRADHAATKPLTISERKDYASLLLEGLRSSGNGAGERELPCPTASLISTRHRSVKMRLSEIVGPKPISHKHRWKVALLLTTLGASLLGLTSTAASVTEEILKARADGIVYVNRTAAPLPASCPGLKIGSENIATQELVIDGEPVEQQSAKLGSVVLLHDVRRDGSTHNFRVKSSTHPCFEAEARATVAQWITAPQDEEIKDVGVKLQFFMTAETIEELKPKLSDFLQ